MDDKATSERIDSVAVVSKGISEEQLTKELDIAVKEILERQEKEKESKILTNPSAIALSEPVSDTGESLSKVKKSVRQLFALYLTNQYVARAINVRADTLISRGYDILEGDEEGREKCKALIMNSGGSNLFKQLGINADIAGDGFLEKIYNANKTAILRLKHVHPLTLGFKKDKKTDMILVGKDKEPVGYVQLSLDKDGKEIETDIDKSRIEHLKYNCLGDEFTGVSVIQPSYDTIVRLMNMEYSAAEAAVKTANPLMVAICNSKSPNQIAQWATIMGRISGQEQLFIPEGMKIEMIHPGPQNFSDYSEYFLNGIVAGFGVPKSVLLGESGGNRAEGIILSRHFYSVIKGLQDYQCDFFNKIFKEYGELAGFEAPKLYFNDIAEDASLLAQSAIQLVTAGIINVDEAREMIGLERTGNTKFVQGQSADIKKSDREVQFPASPGKVAGSQKNIKNTQKADPNSIVKATSK